ncbi:BatD family protein [Alteromonas sp. ASW11-130]|uniref:BatD family protein n=1 Tax=Alteromonas sp. ASW11-130 TaxID=3015775 RepID=UPI002241FB4A|nr:BatD family protein [Alteromonas sp. ASW11-130]MCW8093052.1 BatD family protein [Alteromonas sp. ASW11-130]
MKWLYATLLCVAFSFNVFAEVEKVEASVDKNPVMIDEAIVLSVTAYGDPKREAFDSSPLLKDFVVGRTSVSSKTSIINFDTTRTTTWSTTLFPRGKGKFTIPAFTIEGKQTKPISIEVVDVKQDANQPARDYYVTTEVDAHSVYLHQQIRYTVKLFLATNIERGSLDAPKLAKAQIKQLGEDKQYTDIVNGRRYQVIERTFAVIPQQSGDFTIRGPVFSGEVMASNSSQRFGFFNRTHEVNRIGPDIDITVKSKPENVSYHWLPSEFVRLDEEWQSEEFVVGEPVTRTVSLTAVGLVEEQLPELPQHYPPHFKLYPDQAVTATVDKNNTLIAQRKESIAIIPTQAGEFVLPEVTIPWFNVLTEQTEYATLPARTITIKSAPASSQATSPALPASETKAETADWRAEEPKSSPGSTLNYSIVWMLVALLFIALTGWMYTWTRYRKLKAAYETNRNQVPSSETKNNELAYKQLINDIESGHSTHIYQSLMNWINTFAPKRVNAPAEWSATQVLQPHVDNLFASEYGNHASTWDSKAFKKQISTLHKQFKNSDDKGAAALPTLYPQ